jgi:glutathione synthase/RimK-type ligase-like ATP-grasp enzyme
MNAPRLRVATCLALPEPDADQDLLLVGLGAAGVAAELAAWDDGAVTWDDGTPVLVRSTWNYARRPAAFERWCHAVAAAGPLWNPPAVIANNLNKRYLLAMQARGVPTVPTELVRQGGPQGALPALLAARGWTDFVIKPAIAAGSLGARRFGGTSIDAAMAHVEEWLAHSDLLVQPYLASVEGPGERSLVWIDGEFTHAVRKSPRFSGDAEAITGPFPIATDELAVATAAIAPWTDDILYGRVDVGRDPAGRPLVMELELIEPSLFMNQFRPALERLIAGIVRRLSTALLATERGASAAAAAEFPARRPGPGDSSGS